MGYEESPACEMLASNCAICSRPLVDAVSVETGIGPVCREKHGYNAEAEPAAREEANRLVHAVAASERDEEVVTNACARLRELGFEMLAARIETRGRNSKVRIESADGGFLVRAPYKKAAVPAWRGVPGRRWRPEHKANFVPARAKAALWDLLKAFYAGYTGEGPKGEFAI